MACTCVPQIGITLPGELGPLGGILGPLKSELGVFWLDFGSFFAWFYNVKTQKNAFSQKGPNRIGWFLVYPLPVMSSTTVPNPANGSFLSRSSRLSAGWTEYMNWSLTSVWGVGFRLLLKSTRLVCVKGCGYWTVTSHPKNLCWLFMWRENIWVSFCRAGKMAV